LLSVGRAATQRCVAAERLADRDLNKEASADADAQTLSLLCGLPQWPVENLRRTHVIDRQSEASNAISLVEYDLSTGC
jgi:hypothetical protein